MIDFDLLKKMADICKREIEYWNNDNRNSFNEKQKYLDLYMDRLVWINKQGLKTDIYGNLVS